MTNPTTTPTTSTDDTPGAEQAPKLAVRLRLTYVTVHPFDLFATQPFGASIGRSIVPRLRHGLAGTGVTAATRWAQLTDEQWADLPWGPPLEVEWDADHPTMRDAYLKLVMWAEHHLQPVGNLVLCRNPPRNRPLTVDRWEEVTRHGTIRTKAQP